MNVSKKTNVSLKNIHVTSLPPVPMLTSALNALVLKDMTVQASVLLMVVADVSMLTNATMVLQFAQITPPATTTTVATIVTVTWVIKNLQMVTMYARMSMNVPALIFSYIIASQKLIALTTMAPSHVLAKQVSMTLTVTVVYVSKLMNVLMALTTVTT